MTTTTGPVNLLIATPLGDEFLDRIRAVDPRINVINRPDLLGTPTYIADHHPPANRTPAQEAEFRDLIAQAEIIFDLDTDTAPHYATLGTNLRWIQTTSAGVGPAIKRFGLDQTDVIVTTSSGVHAGPLAEFVMMSALMFIKNAAYLLAEKQQHSFNRFCAGEMTGKTLAVVGPGRVGSNVARLARAFGMRTTALPRRDRSAEEIGVDKVYQRAELHTMLAEADVVVLIMPHTPETENMIDAAAIAQLKPTAILVNIARGQVIDEDALIDALRNNRIAGAALDVFRKEPLPADSPLWDLPNVIINPHSASTADTEDAKITDLFCENLRYYLDGDYNKMRSKLDKQQLY
ncbi:MAG: D-2-hydroxyacid dehydrogenase [Thermomicrobiales bacterium]